MSFFTGPMDWINQCVFSPGQAASQQPNTLINVSSGSFIPAAAFAIHSIFIDYGKNKELLKKIRDNSEFLNVTNNISPSYENREIHLSDYLAFVDELAEVLRLYSELIKKDCDDIENAISIFSNIDLHRGVEVGKLGAGSAVKSI